MVEMIDLNTNMCLFSCCTVLTFLIIIPSSTVAMDSRLLWAVTYSHLKTSVVTRLDICYGLLLI